MSEIIYNEPLSRYEQVVDGHMVYARIRVLEGVMYIDYVEADPALRGSGATGRFMSGLMDIARTEQLKVQPICDYAASWVQRHIENYLDIVA